MLHSLRARYADKPVRFLLFPCNQFGSQEPKANSDIKTFAEKSVKLGSTVLMFAKSNLNNVSCAYEGKDACTPASKECCSLNDGVYQYLLATTPPGKIAWNFDKIIVDQEGQPYAGEEILHGGDVEAKVSAIVDGLLQEKASLGALPGATPASGAHLGLVAAFALAALSPVAGWEVVRRLRATGEQDAAPYLRIA
mmetsp:Transcript_16114/g.41702  ORF Transcript_16114/g.41702 Transcript_16114/m.41702 type:complete len:195 (-) Transcript_16114:97-681(-)